MAYSREQARIAEAKYDAANREKRAAAAAARRAADPEKVRQYTAATVDAQRARRLAWNAANPGRQRMHWATRRTAKMLRTPAWADADLIAGLYELAALLSRGGVVFEVDHEIPLRGKRVSGLHTHENLRVIPRYQNRAKQNRFQEE